MSRPRLSRVESQEQTRRLIVEAATGLFLDHGYQPTSLEQVARQAGFTIGAVYSNFGNKLELGIAVVDALYERRIGRALESLESASGQGLDASLDRLWAAMEPDFGNPQWMRLEMEVAAFGSQDNRLRTSVANRYARFRMLLVALIARLSAEAGTPMPADADARATAIVGLAFGLAIQRATDPHIPMAQLGAILRNTVKTIIGARA